jgi:hypothetical protein
MIQQDAIRKEIAEIQEDNPDLSFTAAWERLKRQKPHLFGSAQPQGQTANNALARAQMGRELKRTVDGLCQSYPGMDTSTLFSLARQQNPALFVKAARIENGEGLDGRKLVRAANYERDYIMLRAEDADELERQVASGLWD